ncbi:MAG: type II toxin-antitoxin system HicA family toxin [Tannerella sp.]
MKRVLLEKRLRALGCTFHRNGANHDIWSYENGRKFPLPRHADIEERLSRSILFRAGQNRKESL